MPSIGHRPAASARVRRTIPALAGLPRPLFSRAEALPPGAESPPHSHDWAQFSYAGSGIIEVHTPAGTYLAPPQYAVWVPPGVEHYIHNAEAAELRSLYLRADVLAGLPEECAVLAVTPLARELVLAVGNLPPDYDEIGADGRLVAVLLDCLAALPAVAYSVPMPATPRLGRLCAELAAQPDDPRGLAEWAVELACSERTLAREFRLATGLTFREWRRRLRLLSALSALERGSSVTAVALDCGFESTSAFIAAFRAMFGTTPSTLRRTPRGGRLQRQ